VQRLKHLLGPKQIMSTKTLMQFQRDVHLDLSLVQRDALLSWISSADKRAASHVVAALTAWDGNYDAHSYGALAFELVFFHLARALIPAARESAYDSAWGTRALTWADILAARDVDRAQALTHALKKSARDFGRGKTWGTRHRLRLAHPLGIIPGIGRRFRLPDWPASGTSETLMKTAHGLTNKRHHARYGSVARHVSDMSDLDANHFTLLGGQDGWFGSSTFADQVPLWRQGAYVTLPLRPETVRATFPHRTTLLP
jgi:penicillin amidase